MSTCHDHGNSVALPFLILECTHHVAKATYTKVDGS